MAMEISAFYREIGVDVKDVVSRMGLTEKHLKKYLRKFMDNKEYDKLTRAVEENDSYNVEWAAHTLKGVCANLGLNNLLSDFQEIVNSVRSDDTARIPELYRKSAEDYNRVIALLEEVDFGDQ
jgi:HPt (histidine-containing phosphotransfer) domain-containing protein